jgi:hypothetical protein
MTKAEALDELGKPLYDPDQLRSDKEYILKKFDLTTDEFEKIMHLPVQKHQAFKSDRKSKEIYMNMLIRTEPIRRSLKRGIGK